MAKRKKRRYDGRGRQATEAATEALDPVATQPATDPSQDATEEAVTPAPGGGYFPRLDGETVQAHRAFLLWVMQEESKRSYRLAARAAEVSDMAIRRWVARYTWAARLEGKTRTDGLAWREWLATYAESGVHGIAIVQANMAIEGPLTPLAYLKERVGARAIDPRSYPKGSAARAVLEAAAEASRQAMGGTLDGDEEGVEPGLGLDGLGEDGQPRRNRADANGQPSSPRDDDLDPVSRRKRVKDFRRLIRASLAVYTRDVRHTLNPEMMPNGNQVRIAPRDVPILIELEQALSEVPDIPGDASGPIESVRVRIARERGEDVLQALVQDHEEQGVILHALTQKRKQDGEHLRKELARSQSQAEVVPIDEAG